MGWPYHSLDCDLLSLVSVSLHFFYNYHHHCYNPHLSNLFQYQPLLKISRLLYYFKPWPHHTRGHLQCFASPENTSRIEEKTVFIRRDLHQFVCPDESIPLLIKDPEGLPHLVLYVRVLELPSPDVSVSVISQLYLTLSSARQTR